MMDVNDEPFTPARRTVLRELLKAEVTRPRESLRHRRPAAIAVVVTLLATLVGTGGAAWAITGSPLPIFGGTLQSVPLTTNRAPDPTPTGPRNTTNTSNGSLPQISASEASLNQLWAISHDAPPISDQNNPAAWNATDFQAAIATRCYPGIPTDESTQLDALYAAISSAQAASPFVVADMKMAYETYFEQATAWCM